MDNPRMVHGGAIVNLKSGMFMRVPERREFLTGLTRGTLS